MCYILKESPTPRLFLIKSWKGFSDFETCLYHSSRLTTLTTFAIFYQFYLLRPFKLLQFSTIFECMHVAWPTFDLKSFENRMITEFRNGNSGTFSWLLTNSRLQNKRKATFINFLTFFLVLRSYLRALLYIFFQFWNRFENIWLIVIPN